MITRQSALPEGAEKELSKTETNRSNLRREQTDNSKKQAKRNLSLDGPEEKDDRRDSERISADVDRDDTLPVPSLHKTVPRKHMPEGLQEDVENGGIGHEKV